MDADSASPPSVRVSRLHFGESTMTIWPPITWADACILINAYETNRSPVSCTKEEADHG